MDRQRLYAQGMRPSSSAPDLRILNQDFVQRSFVTSASRQTAENTAAAAANSGTGMTRNRLSSQDLFALVSTAIDITEEEES